ncbi:hypothetical protein EMN47_19975 [Prolixibacteraceae bacterium JC049]|nr:hypothetical protein [Prolixibacteraceae bacterium JC049]
MIKTFALAVLLAIASLGEVTGQVKSSYKRNLFCNSVYLLMDASTVTFEFNSIEDYEKGLGRNREYRTLGAVDARVDWELYFWANTEMVHEDGYTRMPLNNIGVTMEYLGRNRVRVNGRRRPITLKRREQWLIRPQGCWSNRGCYLNNMFFIYWEMGTCRGRMNKKNLYKQNLKKGTYRTEVEFAVVQDWW